MTLDEVGDLLVSELTETIAKGNYTNRRGVLGYYLKTKSGQHWCKVSVSHAERHADRTSLEELNAIEPGSLGEAVGIPTQSISLALKSSIAREAPLQKYENVNGIEGLWAEFQYQGNWYMVSVSHIDIPARMKSSELEMIADELLRQQGDRVHRRAKRW